MVFNRRAIGTNAIQTLVMFHFHRFIVKNNEVRINFFLYIAHDASIDIIAEEILAAIPISIVAPADVDTDIWLCSA